MTDEQITALMARLRTFVQRNGHNDMAVTTIDTDHARAIFALVRAILALVDAQAAENARLREVVAKAREAERARIVAWLHNHDFEDDTFNEVSVVLAHAIKRLNYIPDAIEAQETQP